MTQEVDTKSPITTRGGPLSFTEQLIEPLSRLRSEIDRMFDDFPRRFPTLQLGRLGEHLSMPAVEMTETRKAYKLTVELPGIDAKDIKVEVEGDMLVISGEKKEEREEEEQGYRLSECSYGAFERRIALPSGADADRISAKAKNGVLRINLPKNEKAVAKTRKVEVQST